MQKAGRSVIHSGHSPSVRPQSLALRVEEHCALTPRSSTQKGASAHLHAHDVRVTLLEVHILDERTVLGEECGAKPSNDDQFAILWLDVRDQSQIRLAVKPALGKNVCARNNPRNPEITWHRC